MAITHPGSSRWSSSSSLNAKSEQEVARVLKPGGSLEIMEEDILLPCPETPFQHRDRTNRVASPPRSQPYQRTSSTTARKHALLVSSAKGSAGVGGIGNTYGRRETDDSDTDGSEDTVLDTLRDFFDLESDKSDEDPDADGTQDQVCFSYNYNLPIHDYKNQILISTAERPFPAERNVQLTAQPALYKPPRSHHPPLLPRHSLPRRPLLPRSPAFPPSPLRRLPPRIFLHNFKLKLKLKPLCSYLNLNPFNLRGRTREGDRRRLNLH